jgi:hypothetical protein
MPATSAGMTVEIDASHVGNALVLDAALLFPLRLAAIAGDKGRVLRAEAAVALDHRLSAALERIEGAFLLDAAADVLAGAPGAFIDVAMPPAEQHALVLEQLRGGRAGAKTERRRNGQGCNQDGNAHRNSGFQSAASRAKLPLKRVKTRPRLIVPVTVSGNRGGHQEECSAR